MVPSTLVAMGTSEGAAGRSGAAQLDRWSTEGKRPSQLLLAGLLLGLLSFLLALLIGRVSYLHQAIGGMLGPFGLVVALACVAVEFLRLVHRRALGLASFVNLAALWVLVFAPFAGACLSAVLPVVLHGRRVEEARAWCEGIIQRLVSHRQANGAYPGGIESWRDQSKRSDLIDGVEYHRDEAHDRYRLGFSETVENMSGFALHFYDSERGSWFSFDSTFDFSFEEDQLPYWLGEVGSAR